MHDKIFETVAIVNNSVEFCTHVSHIFNTLFVFLLAILNNDIYLDKSQKVNGNTDFIKDTYAAFEKYLILLFLVDTVPLIHPSSVCHNIM